MADIRAATPIRAMTFNIRFDGRDDARSWSRRRAAVFDLIRTNAPDLIAIQEPDASQWADISATLDGYAPFGVFDNETNDVEPKGGFFRTERFECRQEGVFWLSGTPFVPHSVSWPTDWEPRACGWCRLRDRWTGRELVFAGTHFDTNEHAWLPSAKTLSRELDRIAHAAPIVIAGDFNCAAGSEAHRYLTARAGYRDTWHETGHSDQDTLTFHGFSGLQQLPADLDERKRWLKSINGDAEFAHYSSHVATHQNFRIDWILLRGELRCLEARIDCWTKPGEPPSDHFPVIALLAWE